MVTQLKLYNNECTQNLQSVQHTATVWFIANNKQEPLQAGQSSTFFLLKVFFLGNHSQVIDQLLCKTNE